MNFATDMFRRAPACSGVFRLQTKPLKALAFQYISLALFLRDVDVTQLTQHHSLRLANLNTLQEVRDRRRGRAANISISTAT
jgi:hypothetical protein